LRPGCHDRFAQSRRLTLSAWPCAFYVDTGVTAISRTLRKRVWRGWERKSLSHPISWRSRETSGTPTTVPRYLVHWPSPLNPTIRDFSDRGRIRSSSPSVSWKEELATIPVATGLSHLSCCQTRTRRLNTAFPSQDVHRLDWMRGLYLSKHTYQNIPIETYLSKHGCHQRKTTAHLSRSP
jgi:hypothetical protein